MRSKTSAESWYSRNYIPHFDRPGQIQLVTFRLYDAVPEKVLQGWKEELEWSNKVEASDPRQVKLRKWIDKYEDSGCGNCWLLNENIADLVQRTLFHFHGERYCIHKWCIMPNHVHVITEMLDSHLLCDTVHSWKSYTGHEANKILKRSGAFWFREYHDRYVRDEIHLAAAIKYVENNPVKAGLITAKQRWRWSSAWSGPGSARPATP